MLKREIFPKGKEMAFSVQRCIMLLSIVLSKPLLTIEYLEMSKVCLRIVQNELLAAPMQAYLVMYLYIMFNITV